VAVFQLRFNAVATLLVRFDGLLRLTCTGKATGVAKVTLAQPLNKKHPFSLVKLTVLISTS
jgi:hypothetical protein